MTTAEWHPGTLLQLSGAYWQTCTLHAGVKLDVFSLIGDGRHNSEALAGKIDCPPESLSRLLNALTAMGLLVKEDHHYANTEGARTFLSQDSPKYIGHIIMHHHFLVESWANLDRAVQTGEPVRKRASTDSDQRRESFLMGMFNLAMNLAPKIVPQIDLSGRKQLLDMGGGPGTYAIHFCRNYPSLQATVFDLSTTQPFAEKTIARFDLTDRIHFAAGSYLEDDLPGPNDVVWMSHILHAEDPAACQMMIDKAAASLNPGGLILIHDFYLNDAMDGPLFPALFSLNMLLGTTGGQAYSEKQVSKMMSKAGVTDIRRIDFDSPNDSAILIGKKPE